METRNLKISKETATRWYNGNDTELKQLTLQTFPELGEKELPKSWEELEKIRGYRISTYDTKLRILEVHCNHTDKEISKIMFATREQAEASIALAQLSQLMKVYNGDWVVDFSKEDCKYCIHFENNEITFSSLKFSNCFLCFNSTKTRDLFLENFRDLILTAKPLLG